METPRWIAPLGSNDGSFLRTTTVEIHKRLKIAYVRAVVFDILYPEVTRVGRFSNFDRRVFWRYVVHHDWAHIYLNYGGT